MEYFKEEEFECPCCKENHMDQEFLGKLDDARDTANVPFKINSGYRCSVHNKHIGGSLTSSHLDGYAADIECNNSVDRCAIVDALSSAGFTRVGIAKTFIHVDNDPNKAMHVMWIY